MKRIIVMMIMVLLLFTSISFAATEVILSNDEDVTVELIAQNSVMPPSIFIYRVTDNKTGNVIYITKFKQQVIEVGMSLNNRCNH
jgi:hypothetical protein